MRFTNLTPSLFHKFNVTWRAMERAMERAMFGVSLMDRFTNKVIVEKLSDRYSSKNQYDSSDRELAYVLQG